MSPATKYSVGGSHQAYRSDMSSGEKDLPHPLHVAASDFLLNSTTLITMVSFGSATYGLSPVAISVMFSPLLMVRSYIPPLI
ncbi:hypothetical protein FA15DRAFT_138598 [Coprinopsis marcescibilis]|uniref:Uncharacterized protein n=1 Tax=Coprinopsis marcescibilis TaxID=230819 RepID=A0A5C3KJ66_COPMA|nr:hypothetical protein FA15DRAFT_138598 [Coprinopsis marcescibilis]